MLCECVLIYLRDVQNTRRKKNDSCFGWRARKLKHHSHIKRGVNTYSITTDYPIPRKVVFTMFDYLEDVIVEADKDLNNSSLCYPSNDSLMKVDYNSPSLSTKDAGLVHCHVARLLFTSKRVRPDI